jgi:dephospho-CoA kinase
VEPGRPALDDIVAHFGSGILDAEGRLDRAALRARVFDDPGERQVLEQILHPRIRAAMLERAAASRRPYVVFVIPLLLETGQQALVDRVLLIDAPETLQRERAAVRDGVDPAQIDRILAAQTDRATRRRHADDIIVNDGDLPDLYAQIEDLHRKYLAQVRP